MHAGPKCHNTNSTVTLLVVLLQRVSIACYAESAVLSV